jgi:hypothetical protein
MLEAMAAAPMPALEVVSLGRTYVENILRELEDARAKEGGSLIADPGQSIRVLRDALAEPKVELWAVHSVGPGEVVPCLSKDDAEQQAQELRDWAVKAGEGKEHWPELVVNVVPSPWEPTEHFELIAEAWKEHYEELRASYVPLKSDHERVSNNRDMWKGQVERQAEELTTLRVERDQLLASLQLLYESNTRHSPVRSGDALKSARVAIANALGNS